MEGPEEELEATGEKPPLGLRLLSKKGCLHVGPKLSHSPWIIGGSPSLEESSLPRVRIRQCALQHEVVGGPGAPLRVSEGTPTRGWGRDRG